MIDNYETFVQFHSEQFKELYDNTFDANFKLEFSKTVTNNVPSYYPEDRLINVKCRYPHKYGEIMTVKYHTCYGYGGKKLDFFDLDDQNNHKDSCGYAGKINNFVEKYAVDNNLDKFKIYFECPFRLEFEGKFDRFYISQKQYDKISNSNDIMVKPAQNF